MIDYEGILEKTEEFAKRGLIDDLRSLKDKRTFSFTGENDEVVPVAVGKTWSKFLRHYGADHYEKFDQNCGHSFPTDDQGNGPNELVSPFISNCEYRGAYEALNWLFHNNIIDSHEGLKYSNIFKFSQSVYNPVPNCMNEIGYAYVPTKCQEEGSN